MDGGVFDRRPFPSSAGAVWAVQCDVPRGQRLGHGRAAAPDRGRVAGPVEPRRGERHCAAGRGPGSARG